MSRSVLARWSVAALIALVGAPSATAAFTPAGGSPFAVGGMDPAAIAVGDFDAAGVADLATANVGSADVSILLDIGGGEFAEAPGSPYPVGTQPSGIALGDFDGNGALDVVTSNLGAGTVSLLLGSGTGGFSPAPGSPFPVGGAEPAAIAVGDLDADGDLDLATANFGSDSVSVLLGNGSGGFAPAAGSPFAAGVDPAGVAVGDFDGNGSLDLVATDSGWHGSVALLLGDGSGAFVRAPGSPFDVDGRNPNELAVADFDGNGDLDVVTANSGDTTVSLLLGNGAGGLSEAPGSPFSAHGSAPASVVAGDFDADGNLDAVVANSGSDDVALLLGDGAGRLALATDGLTPVGGATPAAVAAGDLDGTGGLDVATANFHTDDVSVLLDDPVPYLHPASRNFGAVRIGSAEAQAFVLENRGAVDLAVFGVAVTGPDAASFPVVVETCSAATLAPGGRCLVVVEFAPTAAGAQSATLEVTDDAPTSPQTAALTGLGVQGGTAAAGLTPGHVAFGEVTVGSSRTAVFTLVSTGTRGVRVGAARIAGRDARHFHVTRNRCLGLVLAPGQECEITVAFAPTSAGVRVAHLEVEDDAIDHPQTAGLAGIGAPPPSPPPPGGTGPSSGCDPLIQACAPPDEEESSSLPAPPASSGDGAAVGGARMPDLRVRIRARQESERVRVTVRLAISKPQLVRGRIRVLVSIPSLGMATQVSLPGKGPRTARVVFTVAGDATGRAVVATVDPADAVAEARERNNRARTLVRPVA